MFWGPPERLEYSHSPRTDLGGINSWIPERQYSIQSFQGRSCGISHSTFVTDIRSERLRKTTRNFSHGAWDYTPRIKVSHGVLFWNMTTSNLLDVYRRWFRRQDVPPKRKNISTVVHSATSRKTGLFEFRAGNPPPPRMQIWRRLVMLTVSVVLVLRRHRRLAWQLAGRTALRGGGRALKSIAMNRT